VIGKNGEVLLDRPKPIAGCSANGRRRNIVKTFKVFEYRLKPVSKRKTASKL
jgi:hypothetical protein